MINNKVNLTLVFITKISNYETDSNKLKTVGEIPAVFIKVYYKNKTINIIIHRQICHEFS